MLCRVTIYGTYGGQGHINVLNIGKDAPSLLDYFSLGQNVEDFWIGTHKGNVQQQMQWNRVHVEDLSHTYDAYDHPVSQNGVLGSTQLYCPFLCAVFKFHTHTPGRHGRGRSSQGGYDGANVFNGGLWAIGTKNRLDDVATGLAGYWVGGIDVNTHGWMLCVASRSVTTFDEAHPVTSITASSKVGTINTRKIGRGF
jgi:hypothetical protein